MKNVTLNMSQESSFRQRRHGIHVSAPQMYQDKVQMLHNRFRACAGGMTSRIQQHEYAWKPCNNIQVIQNNSYYLNIVQVRPW